MSSGAGGRIRIAALAALGLLMCAEGFAARARVALRWEPVEGASAYELEIAKDKAFKEVVLREQVPTAGYRWRELPATTFFWRVRSLDKDGRAGPWSEAKPISAQVAPPGLSSPAAGARLACVPPCSVDVAFEAQPVIETYILELSSTPGFEHPARVSAPAPALKAELPSVGTWYLRAIGVDLAHRETAPGEVRRVIAVAPAPEPTEPRRGAVRPFDASTPVRFTWAAPEGWSRFVLEVRGKGPPIHREVSGRAVALSLPAPGNWSWRLRAVLGGGARSDWSAWIPFTVSPGAPALATPEEGASFGTRLAQREVTLSWTGDAASFVVETSPDAAFAAPRELAAACCSARMSAPPGHWFWRVVPLDAAGNRGAPSEARAFDVAALDPLRAPALSAPADGSVVAPGPLAVAWSAVAEAAAYEVRVEPEGLVAPVHVAEPRVELALQSDGVYRVRVRALDQDGAAGAFSEPRELFVGPPPTARVERGAWPENLRSGEVTEVTLALIDARGRRIEHAPLELRFDGAPVVPSPEPDGSWSVRIEAPAGVREGRDAELSITDRGFTTRETIRILPAEGPARVALQVGVANNVGARTAAYVGGDAWYRLPVFGGRIALGARAGTYGGTVRVNAADAPSVGADVVTRATPVAITASYLHRVGRYQLRGGVGGGITPWWIDAPDESGGGIAPLGQVFAGAGTKVGPGVLALDASFGFGGEAALASTRMRTTVAIVALSYGVSP